VDRDWVFPGVSQMEDENWDINGIFISYLNYIKIKKLQSDMSMRDAPHFCGGIPQTYK
jgi:hypothetical protein